MCIRDSRYIKCNKFGQLETKALETQIKDDLKNGYVPFYINATAGTTVLCAFDDIFEISKISKKYNIWLHVDGAFGGSVIFTKNYFHLLSTLKDSIQKNYL